MTACGNKEYLKDIKAADYVTLGEYTGIEASAKEPVVEDGMVDLYIEMYIKPAYTTTEEVTDRADQSVLESFDKTFGTDRQRRTSRRTAVKNLPVNIACVVDIDTRVRFRHTRTRSSLR